MVNGNEKMRQTLLSRRTLLASLGSASVAVGATVVGMKFNDIGVSANGSTHDDGAEQSRPVFNAKQFGALGDGETDDTGSIQAAIDAANDAGGGNVYLPVGTYMTYSPLKLYSYVIICGEGDASIIQASTKRWGLTTRGIIEILGTKKAGVMNLCIDQQGSKRLPANNVSYSILVNNSEDGLIENVTFLDSGIDPSFGHPSSPPLNMVARDIASDLKSSGGGIGGCYRFRIRHCRFIQNGTAELAFAIRILSDWDRKLPTDEFTYYNEGHMIEGCHFDGEYSWNTIEFAGGATRYNKVLGCTFIGRTLTAIDFDKGANYNVAAYNTIMNGGKPNRHIDNTNTRLAAIHDHGTSAPYINYGNTIAMNSIHNLNNDTAKDVYEAAISVAYAEDSLIIGNKINGVNQGRLGGGICIDRAIDNIIIKDNQIRNVRMGIFTNANSSSTNGVTIENNQIISERDCILISLQPGGGKRLRIVGNTMQTLNGTYCLGITAALAVSNPIIAQNIGDGGETTFMLNGTNATVFGNVAENAKQKSFRMQQQMTVMGNVAVAPADREHQGSPTITYGENFPNSGFWRQGDIVYHTKPAPRGNVGWICTLGGQPGIWKSFGTIGS